MSDDKRREALLSFVRNQRLTLQDTPEGEEDAESKAWPTTGSEEKFRRLNREQLWEMGFDPNDCTFEERLAYMDKCEENLSE